MASSTIGPTSTTPLLIAGRYEVMLSEVLGKGGLATVYRARDTGTGRMIAAKRLNDEHMAQAESIRRFRREFRMTSYAHPHPNIVGFVDYVEDPPWLMLELVEGGNLKHQLGREGPLGLESAVGIVAQIAEALDHLHARKVVHLDLKPQNLIVTADGIITLIDFGVAQEFASQQDRVAGHLYGTAAYMAPEQPARRPVDARTDVYALGCVFYELVTGRPPFEAPGLTGETEQLALIDAHATEEARPPSEVRPDLALPSWVDDVADRALAKNPDHRFAEAGDLARAARRGMGLPVQPRRRPTERLNQPPVRPHRGEALDGEAPAEPVEAGPVEPRGPGLVRRTWVAGGRRLRESPRVRRMAMRTMMLLAVIVMVVGLNMAASSGLVADVVVDVVPAMTTDVTIAGLNLRAEPSIDGEVLAELPLGSDVRITGGPERTPGYTWWPVTADVDGETSAGWVWADGVEHSTWMQAVTWPKTAADGVRGAIETVTGWIP